MWDSVVVEVSVVMWMGVFGCEKEMRYSKLLASASVIMGSRIFPCYNYICASLQPLELCSHLVVLSTAALRMLCVEIIDVVDLLYIATLP
jgi:hypothetical protein